MKMFNCSLGVSGSPTAKASEGSEEPVLPSNVSAGNTQQNGNDADVEGWQKKIIS